ncbi:MAG: 3-keto-disaccharide hydrolase [Prosthecobacter sp.]
MTLRLLLFCLALPCAAASAAEPWHELFNGKDLTGWRANVMPESFKVVDGAIRVNATKPSAHLFYCGKLPTGFARFKNFVLEATCRSEPNSNSGIFIHTDMTTRDAAQHLAKGYEIQLNSSQKEKRKTGSLYAVVDLAQSPVDEGKWFQVRITVRDKRITIELNGKQVVDYTEPPNVTRPKERAGRLFAPEGGGIALQAHDPGSVFHFKDLRLQMLP